MNDEVIAILYDMNCNLSFIHAFTLPCSWLHCPALPFFCLILFWQAVESFSANTTDIGAALRKFSRRLQDTELPNDVPATQAVLQHQSQEYAALKTELRNANAQGETLLNLIKKPACTYGSNVSPAIVRRNDPWPGQLVNVTTVER